MCGWNYGSCSAHERWEYGSHGGQTRLETIVLMRTALRNTVPLQLWHLHL